MERIRHAVEANIMLALKELQQHPWFVFILILLALAVLAPAMVLQDADRFSIKFFTYLAAGLILLAFTQRHAFFLVSLLSLPANLAYLHLTYHWGSEQLDSRIEAAFESPPREALEYLQAHLDGVDASIIVLFVLYLVALIYVTFRIKRPQLPGLQKIAIVALIVWLLTMVTFQLERKFSQFPPYGLTAEVMHAKARYELLKGRRIFLAEHPLATTKCSKKYDKVVIVLGESAVSDHMSVFGYHKPTTPFAVRSRPHAFSALAPSNQTRYSLAMMLTDASPGSFDTFYRQHSLIGELRACGYRTLWISNQGRVGAYDSFTTSLAMEADSQAFLNEWSWTDTHYDGQIVNELASRDIYARHNQVTFVHLIGSHTRYDERYPKSFGFTDVSGTVEQYDNSLLYTDYVLSRLYERFSDDSSLLFIYVSDHGQYVSQGKFGSGFLPGYQEEYRIPLLIWTHDSQSIKLLRAAIGDLSVNTDSLNAMVHFLLGNAVSPRVSTSKNVSVLAPENVVNYDQLRAFDGN